MSGLMNLSSLTTTFSGTSFLPPVIPSFSPTWQPIANNSTEGSHGMFQESLLPLDSPFAGLRSMDSEESRVRQVRYYPSRQQLRREKQDDDEPDKKRRSLNLPTNQKPRFSRLYVLGERRMSSARVVEVHQDGSVHTSTNVKSPQCTPLRILLSGNLIIFEDDKK